MSYLRSCPINSSYQPSPNGSTAGQRQLGSFFSTKDEAMPDEWGPPSGRMSQGRMKMVRLPEWWSSIFFTLQRIVFRACAWKPPYIYIYTYILFYCIHMHTYSMFSFVAPKIRYSLLSIGSINQRGNEGVLWDYLWLLIASFLQTSDGQRISGSYGSAVCGTRQDNRGHGKGRAEDGKPSQSRRR